jgi:hypothetical protein
MRGAYLIDPHETEERQEVVAESTLDVNEGPRSHIRLSGEPSVYIRLDSDQPGARINPGPAAVAGQPKLGIGLAVEDASSLALIRSSIRGLPATVAPSDVARSRDLLRAALDPTPDSFRVIA